MDKAAARLRKPPIRCYAGAYFDGSGYLFVVVSNEEHGWYLWDGYTVPDQFAGADGHLYEIEWCDERVQFTLVEANPRLALLRYPVAPLSLYVMTSTDIDFYTIRNRLREMNQEASRTDFENTVKGIDPFLTIGE